MQEVLPAASVLLDVGPADKARAISLAAFHLSHAGQVPADAIETALLARESLGSTGVGGGVGLPHARLHTMRSTHAVFLRLARPIGFDAIDEKPVDLVCAVIAPDEPNAELLAAVSAISRVLRDADKTTQLRRTTSSSQAHELLMSGAGR